MPSSRATTGPCRTNENSCLRISDLAAVSRTFSFLHVVPTWNVSERGRSEGSWQTMQKQVLRHLCSECMIHEHFSQNGTRTDVRQPKRVGIATPACPSAAFSIDRDLT